MLIGERFEFSIPVIKAEETKDGDIIFEACASTPHRDLQDEVVDPQGLDTSYFFGEGLPPGSGGYVNYDHDSTTIVGIPIEGKITTQGFFFKWKALKTKFMSKIIDQMRAMEKSGSLRRYGMSIEGVVKETDPSDPSIIRRAYIRNVALTPTPVNPNSWVSFAKSLTAESKLVYNRHDGKKVAVKQWLDKVTEIASETVSVSKNNKFFNKDGTFKVDGDIAFFKSVCGLHDSAATYCARFALSRQKNVIRKIKKSLTANSGSVLIPQSLGDVTEIDPYQVTMNHLRKWKASHPADPHVDNVGHLIGGDREVAKHFTLCEKRPINQVNFIVKMLHDSKVLKMH